MGAVCPYLHSVNHNSINDSDVFDLGEGKVDIPEKTLRAQKPKTNGTAKEEIRANMVR